MTVRQALKQAAQILYRDDIQEAYFEAEVLLAQALQVSRVSLLSQSERKLTKQEKNSFCQLLKRRLHQEPLAYIIGSQEFYGIKFYVDQRVLIPRPETELLVEEALKVASDYTNRGIRILIADIGTGCGAIAISIALNLPQAKIYASDISPHALEVAYINCQQHKVSKQITLLNGNLLEPLPEPVHLIIANLPYVKSSEIEKLSPEVKDFEPILALDGGEDGLAKIKQLLGQIKGKLLPDGCLLLEIGQGQAKVVTSQIKNHFPKAEIKLITDLNAIERVVKVTF